jgi:beta-phosphoglucomutase-like phosphatase (HAD superfamily)
MIKAIFFDFDGVIAESVNVKTEAFAQLFEEYGSETVAKVVKHHLAHGGVSRFDKIRYYHEEYLGNSIDEQELSEWCRRFSDLVLEKVVSSPYVPGVVELLRNCHKKYSCFIVSGTPQEEMEHIVSRRGLRNFFAEIHGSPRTKIEIF